MRQQYNCAVTDSYTEAAAYKIPKVVNLYVIKDDKMRRYLAEHGSRVRLYIKHKGLFYLPPSAVVPQGGTCPLVTINYPQERLYDFQKEAIDAMREYTKTHKGFFIRSGCGTGKTEIWCGIVSKLCTRAIIVTPTKLIAGQILEDLSQYTKNIAMATGKDISKRIQEYTKLDIFICTHMTFNNNFETLNEAGFELLAIDEATHTPSERIKQFALWKGRYIVGSSGNFKRKNIAMEDFPKIYGGYYDTDKESLPVQVLRYTYKHEYSLDDTIKASEGYAPDSPEIRRKLMSQNPERLEHLRNIVSCLQIEKGINKMVIFTDRKEYCYEIVQYLKQFFGGTVIEMMSGDHNNLEVKHGLSKMDSYIIVAMEQCVREGMNIPALEAGVLFFSTSEENTINQLSGRVRRVYGTKKVGYLIDFVDYINIEGTKNKVLGYSERKKIYERFGFQVEDFNTNVLCGGTLFPELKITSGQ